MHRRCPVEEFFDFYKGCVYNYYFPLKPRCRRAVRSSFLDTFSGSAPPAKSVAVAGAVS